jgi:hypothetical protein
MQKAVLADAEASGLLQTEIDVLMAMGQRHSYQQHRPPRRWTRSGIINTPVWQPGTVTTLTDQCQFDGLYPPPAVPPSPSMWEYHPEIVSLTTTVPALNGLATVSRLVGSMVEIVIATPPSSIKASQRWQLVGGAADPTDPTGQVAPTDYNATTNNKHWVKV